MGEEVPPEAHLHAACRNEHPPPAEIPEPPVQNRKKDHPGDGPDDLLPPVRRGDSVDRIPDHPRDEEPEESGDEQDENAPEVRRPVAAEVGAQGEELADDRPLKSEPDWG